MLGATLVTSAAFALQELKSKPAGGAQDAQSKVVQTQLPSYPLTTCPISGHEITSMGAPFDHVVDGRLVRLCCENCVAKVDADPAAAIAKIDAGVIAQQKTGYPLETCPVSGEPLGAMGDPVDFVHGTRLVRFCCKSCVKGFQKDPSEAMAKIDAALIETQKATYPLTTCVVSEEGLTSQGEPVDMLYGTRLVRFCCKGCVKEFRKDPAKFVAQLDAAKGAKPASAKKIGESH